MEQDTQASSLAEPCGPSCNPPGMIPLIGRLGHVNLHPINNGAKTHLVRYFYTRDADLIRGPISIARSPVYIYSLLGTGFSISPPCFLEMLYSAIYPHLSTKLFNYRHPQTCSRSLTSYLLFHAQRPIR